VRFYNLEECRSETREIAEKILRLQRLQNICLFCYPYEDTQHLISECSSLDRSQYDLRVSQLRQHIRYEKYTGCFKCGFPQSICNEWRNNGHGGFVRNSGATCQFPNLLYEAGAAFLIDDSIRGKLRTQFCKRFSLEDTTTEKIVRKLGMKCRISGMESNFLFRAIVELYS